MTRVEDTIFALASAPGRAGVAVVRVSGPMAPQIVHKISESLPEPRRARLATLKDPASGEAIDRALILWFPAPHSFTGEDVAEFHCHGSRAVISRLLDLLATFPATRLAEPGEFARRAFDHGKLDLTAVEGLADLIDAETEGQRRQALRQAEGALGRLCESWRADIIRASALIEATLDFADEEDIGGDLHTEAAGIARQLHGSLDAHLADAHQGERLRDGFRIVIAGAPNAGKSSLMNALARRDVAITSEEAGTTRDVIEVRLDIAGHPVLVMDTAGIREAAGAVEREGIRRTLARAGEADLILWLTETDVRDETDAEVAAFLAAHRTTPVWQIRSKLDLALESVQMVPPDTFDLAVSAATGAGIPELIERLGQLLGDSASGNPLITRARHRQEVMAARDALAAFLSGSPADVELRAEDLRQAARALGRLTGRIDVEDLLDRIFGEFCIGK
jgi:tRNA modification GTPase